MTIRICFLWLVIAMACPAAEIVAWKVPLESFLNRYLPDEEIPRLSSPPEESPFFSKGDELRDLKGLAVQKPVEGETTRAEGRLETHPPLEWVVWNATTRRLVTKCEWNGVSQLHLRLGPRRQAALCKITADLFEVPEDGSPPKPDSVPAKTLTWLAKSGITSEAATSDDSGMIKCKVEATFDKTYRTIELQLDSDLALKNQLPMNLENRFVLHSGVFTWIARDSKDGKGMDLCLKAEIVTLDGILLDESMMIQRGNAAVPLAYDSLGVSVHQVSEGLWLATYEQSGESLTSLLGPNGPVAEPFGETPISDEQRKSFFPDVPTGEKLRSWFTDPVWDMREEFKKMGLLIGDTDHAGYAPEEGKVFLLSENAEEVFKFKTIWEGGCHLPYKRITITVGNPPQTRIVCFAGTNASIERSGADGKIMREVEFEPTIGDSDNQVDLRVYIRDGPEESPSQELQTSITLEMGRPQLLMGTTRGVELPVTAESETFDPWGSPPGIIPVPQAQLPGK